MLGMYLSSVELLFVVPVQHVGEGNDGKNNACLRHWLSFDPEDQFHKHRAAMWGGKEGKGLKKNVGVDTCMRGRNQ